MKIVLNSLVLQCREDRISINLSHQISFFHGQIGSGKSSIVRLIDFTLGGKLEYTPAIQQELVTATLNVKIGEFDVILERQLDSSVVQVTWKNDQEQAATVLAPIKRSENPIWENTIYSLSDLLFHLMGMKPIMARKSKLQEDTKMIRVSFRDFMWYCYLDQDHLDSSFFRLDDTFKANKSKDVMRFVVGYHSEKLSRLETDLIEKREERNVTINSARELRTFLKRLGFESVGEVEQRIKKTEQKLISARQRRVQLQRNYKDETHIGDNIRQNLRQLTRKLDEEETAIEDLKLRIEEQTSLRSELLSSKFKLARSISIASVLDNVKFDLCPSCGLDISKRVTKSDECYLCHSDTKLASNKQPLEIEGIRLDIDSRIEDLENSIDIHKKSYRRQQKLVKKLRDAKQNMDKRLDEELKNYDSAYLASFRQVDREVARFEERLRGQKRMKELPYEIERLDKKVGTLTGDIESLNRRIVEEKGKLKHADSLIQELEELFKDTLVTVGFPGVSNRDKVEINRTTWNVSIYPYQTPDQSWGFDHAGSGGKKTLFNVSYLLAVHQLAEANKLPLPNLIIIDTPMKNIGEDKNEDIFQKFYEHLYFLADGPLSNTRFVIIDKDFILPSIEVDLYERFMTPDDSNNPPLIPYYTGP